MAYSAAPKAREQQETYKKPSTIWLRLENFFIRIGLLYPQKPFKQMVSDVRVDEGGKCLIRPEGNKLKRPRVLSFPQELNNEIGIVTPMNINQAAAPADMLKSGRSILCNFNGIEKRNLDQVRFFLMGVVYAIGGACKRVNDSIYLFTPATMDVINCQDDKQPFRKDKKEKANEDEEDVMNQFFGT
jgi:FtsZ-interacting cell division protein YlmF